MKKTFDSISKEKKDRIIQACITEFSRYGYEKSSTDRIIKLADISKGGLYEYITSKRDLFLFIVEYIYTRLYNYLRERIRQDGISLPDDILERTDIVSTLAIDFYMDHPEFVSFIVRTYQISDHSLMEEVNQFFIEQYLGIFGIVEESNLRFDSDKVRDLLMWLLLKARYDFLKEIESQKDPAEIRANYFANWRFYLDIMKGGIYNAIS